MVEPKQSAEVNAVVTEQPPLTTAGPTDNDLDTKGKEVESAEHGNVHRNDSSHANKTQSSSVEKEDTSTTTTTIPQQSAMKSDDVITTTVIPTANPTPRRKRVAAKTIMRRKVTRLVLPEKKPSEEKPTKKPEKKASDEIPTKKPEKKVSDEIPTTKKPEKKVMTKAKTVIKKKSKPIKPKLSNAGTSVKSKSKSKTKSPSKGASNLVYEGPPKGLFPGTGENSDEKQQSDWPPGWMERMYSRKNGQTKGQMDRYWYTPQLQHKLRSFKEIERWNRAMKNMGNDESKAKLVYNQAKYR